VDQVARFVDIGGGIEMLDTGMADQRELNAVYLIASGEPAIVETGPAADSATILDAMRLRGIGAADLAHLVVTHIHLDHAGGAGTLLHHFPGAVVWVHERGAPHLADPTRLVASTARTYGEERMVRFFGVTEPVAPEVIRIVEDGDLIRLGDHSLDVLHTPGHASHHVALVDPDSGAVFTGEAVGSHLPWVDVYRPALPPPEVDVDAALTSIGVIASRASRLLTSHFGPIEDAGEGCERAANRIRAWASTVERSMREGADIGAITATLQEQAAVEHLADAGVEIDPSRYDPLGSVRMNAMGLERYWRKRWEREAETAQPS
jgi:glyoxylase-like metal-dependent hydrolase (beta-lactamase superfamily II)